VNSSPRALAAPAACLREIVGGLSAAAPYGSLIDMSPPEYSPGRAFAQRGTYYNMLTEYA
jgi:hypothetical protein